MKDKLKNYFWNNLIAIDQLVNTVFAGDPDETISSRIGKILRDKRKDNRFIYYLSKIICYFLNKIDPGHCKDAIEEDEGKDEI